MQPKRVVLLVKTMASEDAKKDTVVSPHIAENQVPFVQQQVLCLTSITACAVPTVVVPEPFHCQLGNPVTAISDTEIVE